MIVTVTKKDPFYKKVGICLIGLLCIAIIALYGYKYITAKSRSAEPLKVPMNSKKADNKKKQNLSNKNDGVTYDSAGNERNVPEVYNDKSVNVTNAHFQDKPTSLNGNQLHDQYTNTTNSHVSGNERNMTETYDDKSANVVNTYFQNKPSSSNSNLLHDPYTNMANSCSNINHSSPFDNLHNHTRNSMSNGEYINDQHTNPANNHFENDINTAVNKLLNQSYSQQPNSQDINGHTEQANTKMYSNRYNEDVNGSSNGVMNHTNIDNKYDNTLEVDNILFIPNYVHDNHYKQAYEEVLPANDLNRKTLNKSSESGQRISSLPVPDIRLEGDALPDHDHFVNHARQQEEDYVPTVILRSKKKKLTHTTSLRQDTAQPYTNTDNNNGRNNGLSVPVVQTRPLSRHSSIEDLSNKVQPEQVLDGSFFVNQSTGLSVPTSTRPLSRHFSIEDLTANAYSKHMPDNISFFERILISIKSSSERLAVNYRRFMSVIKNENIGS